MAVRNWIRCRCVSGKTIRRTAMFLAVFKLYTHANIYICYYSVWGAISSQELSFFSERSGQTYCQGCSPIMSNTMLASEIAEIIFDLFDNGKYKFMN